MWVWCSQWWAWSLLSSLSYFSSKISFWLVQVTHLVASFAENIVQCSKFSELYKLFHNVFMTLFFRRLRNRDATIYHVQLCIAVFFMLLVFVAGIDQVSRVGGCVLVSILIHYFTLAAIFWMTAEAALMFHKLVLVFRKVTKPIIVVTSLACWCK